MRAKGRAQGGGDLIREVLGATPRERLEWLLAFAHEDLQHLTRQAHSRLWNRLTDLVHEVTRNAWRVRPSRDDESSAFSSWRRSQEMLLTGQAAPVERTLPWLQARILEGAIPPEAREARERIIGDLVVTRVDGPAASWQAVRAHFEIDLFTGVLVCLVTLLGTIPAGLVRRCEFRSSESDPPCGRIFVGKKRQKWCVFHHDAARRERDRLAQQRSRQRLRARPAGQRQLFPDVSAEEAELLELDSDGEAEE